MTRDAVLEEFRSDACDCECDAWACIVDRAMADEIVRLRKERDQLLETKDAVFDNLFRTEEERDAVAKRFTSACDMARQYAETYGMDRAGDNVFQTMRDDAERHRRILAKLRAPSEKILLAAVEAVPYGASYAALQRCLPAAVTAAEQEVAP